MSITVVGSTPIAPEPPDNTDATTRGQTRSLNPDLGTAPEQQNVSPSATYELPQDVVEVHEDPEIKNQIIIDFLDDAKNVILQIPNSEELAVEHGIAEELQQSAKLSISPPAANQGEKTNGH